MSRWVKQVAGVGLVLALCVAVVGVLIVRAQTARVEAHTWAGRLVDAFALDDDGAVIVTLEEGSQARLNFVYQPVGHDWYMGESTRLPAWCEGPERVLARAGRRYVHVWVSCGEETYQYTWGLPEDIQAVFLPVVCQ